jgi:hypothetical protein
MNQKRLRFWMMVAGVFVAPLMFFSTQFTPWTTGNASRTATTR